MPRLEIDEKSLNALAYGQRAESAVAERVNISQMPAEAQALDAMGVKDSYAYRIGLLLLDAVTNPTTRRVAACLAWLRAAFPNGDSIRTLAANLRYLAGELDGN